MPTSALTFRIFLSSPGDVPHERDDAQIVVDEINASGEFKDMFTLIELYRWDNPQVVLPMPVTDIPQQSVDIYMTRPSACDLVVVVFWSRMGSPLVMDSREYLSGTHYEYQEALGGYEQYGTPLVWLYRCQEKLTFDPDDTHFDKKVAQYNRVKAFFTQFMDEEGRFTGGVNAYPTHADFKALFKGQLQTYLRHLRDKGRISPPPPPTKPKVEVPYKGLRPLRKADVPIFFGRTAESLDVLARAENKRFVPILGASGSGKSSLVMAGVLPQLEERDWAVIQCTPDVDPFYQIASVIAELPDYHNLPSDKVLEPRKLADYLRAEPHRLTEKLRQVYPNKRVVIYIDQFEELFTLTEKANPAHVKPFIEAIRHPAEGITTIITMRADFYETALAHVHELKQEAYGLIKPSAFALYEMITRPAQDAGYTLDDRLAETIITQLGDDSGALALMAYLMETLYRRAKGRNDTHITQADYDALGGVENAMNTLAQKAYADLPFADKEAVLRKVFFHLIALTADENGQLVPTRRRTPLADFPHNSPERALIDHFADARLLVTDGQAVEVAHEAILRHWEQLVVWIDQNKGSMAVYRQFERDADVWAHNPQASPLPLHESLKYFYQALDTLGLTWDDLAEPLKSYTEHESARLLREIEDIKTPHFRRMKIGERLVEIGDPRKGVLVRPDGIPDMEWCFVEKGGQITIQDNDKQDHTFMVKPFYVAKYLTTHAQYEAFVKADDGYYNNPELWKLFPEKHRPQKLLPALNPNPNAPRDMISWYQSVAFAHWLDVKYRQNGLFEALLGLNPNSWKISLPPEWYWQWMAQNGDEKREYAWGDWYKNPCANTAEAGLHERSTSVGMYPHGVAKCGAVDVAGNLWEWCLNDWDTILELNGYSNGESKVLRGGSFSDVHLIARTTFRYDYDPYSSRNNFGLRLFLLPAKRAKF